MTTSPKMSSSSSVTKKEDSAIPEETLAYFQQRFRNRLYDLVVGEFQRQQKETGLTQVQLAKKIRKDTGRLNRWLRTPGNWTFDTVSDLLLGISGAELSIDVDRLPVSFDGAHGSAWLNFTWSSLGANFGDSSADIQSIQYAKIPENPSGAVVVDQSITSIPYFLFKSIRNPLIGYGDGNAKNACVVMDDGNE